MNQAEIIICTEAGKLENTSKLLVLSLRKYGGELKNLPIISYQPRKGLNISKNTKGFFKAHNVEHIQMDINRDFANYPLANKPLVCSYHEKNSNAETTIFLDSDMLFLHEPAEFNLNGEHVALRPVGHKNIGASGPEDPNFPYWQHLYKLLGVSNQRHITSVIDNQHILEYYNTGHIISEKNTGLFGQWEKNFRKIMSSDLRPEEMFYLEQSIFGATVSQMNLKVKILKKGYNYPVYFLKNQGKVKDHSYNIPFNEIVSLHYHKAFEKSSTAKLLLDIFKRSNEGQELHKMLLQTGILPSMYHKIWQATGGRLFK